MMGTSASLCSLRSFQCRHSAFCAKASSMREHTKRHARMLTSEENHDEMLSVELTHGTGHSDTVMDTTSSPVNSMRDCPSNDTNADARAALPLVILARYRVSTLQPPHTPASHDALASAPRAQGR